MKRGVLFFLLLALGIQFGVITTWAGQTRDGKEIFESMKCIKCHHPDKKINGPSLKTIVKVYGEKEKLLLFFEGTSDPIVEPERYITMKPRRRKIEKLPKEEKKALTDYFFSFKEEDK